MEKKIDSENNLHSIYEELKKNPIIWDLFTKKEEYHPIKIDNHGRFSYTDSIHKNVLHPSVSEYLFKSGYIPEYPEGKKFCVVLTHDVDDIYIKPRHLWYGLWYLPQNKNFSQFFLSSKGLINRKISSYKNFDKIVELEKKYNVSSTFFFLGSAYDVFGKTYSLEDVLDDLGMIVDHGCEIGFHTGYYSYDSSDEIKKEKEEMERVLGIQMIGARNHVLRFQTPRSWEVLSNAGFSYDTSFGYHDMIGFRNGMCHPFEPFNLLTGKKIDIVEIPLNIQDVTLLLYLKAKPEECWLYIKNLIDTTEKYGGALTILWHTWTFALPVSYGGMFGKYWTKLYEKILDYAIQKNAWITNCKNLHEHYQNNKYFRRNPKN